MRCEMEPFWEKGVMVTDLSQCPLSQVKAGRSPDNNSTNKHNDNHDNNAYNDNNNDN